MPCSDYSDADTIHELSGQVKALTRIACDLAQTLPETGFKHLNLETRNWLKKHAQEDALRRVRERAVLEDGRKRRVALRKLTSEERKLLGVDRIIL